MVVSRYFPALFYGKIELHWFRKRHSYEIIIRWRCCRFSWTRDGRTIRPKIKEKYKPQITVINGGKCSPWKGITEKIYKELLQAGADVVTLGNHAFDNKAIFDFIEDATKWYDRWTIQQEVPGKGIVYVKCNDKEVAVINLQGRVFMNTLDDPFAKLLRRLKKLEREHRLSLSTSMPK